MALATFQCCKQKLKGLATTINRKYFDVKIFLDSIACVKIKRTKYMRNINDDEVQGRLSENNLTWKIIAWNILDMKYSRFTVHVATMYTSPAYVYSSLNQWWWCALVMNSWKEAIGVSFVHFELVKKRRKPSPELLDKAFSTKSTQCIRWNQHRKPNDTWFSTYKWSV